MADEKIIMVSLSDIQEHPEEFDIYGKVEIDDMLVDSIKSKGLLQPILIADNKIMPIGKIDPACKYVLLAGHRRRMVFEALKKKTIPAIVKDCPDYDTSVVLLTESNISREKSEAVRIREYLTLKQKLCQLGKTIAKKGTYNGEEYDIDELHRFGKALKFSTEEPFDARKILMEKYGFSKHRQMAWDWLYNNTKGDAILTKLRKLGMTLKTEQILCQNWEQCVAEYEAKTASLFDAYNTIKGEVEKLEKHLIGDKKAFEKKPKNTTPAPSREGNKKKSGKEEKDIDVFKVLSELAIDAFEPIEKNEGKFLTFKEFATTSESIYGFISNQDKTVGVFIELGKTRYELDMNKICKMLEIIQR